MRNRTYDTAVGYNSLHSLPALMRSLLSHLHNSSFQDGHLHSPNVDMDSTNIADPGVVEAILILSINSKVGHICAVAQFRHQVGAVAHEVIITLVKGGVVGISRGNTDGGVCR